MNDISASFRKMKQKINTNRPALPKLDRKAFTEIKGDGLIKLDNKRISRYRNSPDLGRNWTENLNNYMKARQKVSCQKNCVDTIYEFTTLDRKHQMQKRKLIENQGISSRKYGNHEFLSNLKPEHSQSRSLSPNDSWMCRQEAILINFVSTYFKKKMYNARNKKKHRRNYQTEADEMVCLGGTVVTEFTNQ